MSAKPLPCSEEELREIASQFTTPFYLYDKIKLVKGAEYFNDCFALKMLHEECDMGLDCSSLGELLLCEKLGIKGENIIFTSNNTPLEEYQKASDMGAVINLDDYSQLFTE